MLTATVNGLCVSVLDDSYRFYLTMNGSPPETIEANIAFTSTFNPPDDAISSLSSKFANLDPSSRTIFCVPSTTSTVHLRSIVRIVHKLGLPKLEPKPITYRQAYTASLPATDCPITIQFLECSQESSETELLDFELDSEHTKILEIEDSSDHVVHHPAEDAIARAETIVRELVAPLQYSKSASKRIVILDTHSAVVDALRPALAITKPDVPIHVVSFAELSTGAARYIPPTPRKILAQYSMPLPISIATADGNAVIAVPGTRTLRPAEESILLTTSSDQQPSATLSIYLGDHLRAEDNLLSGIVTLKDLIPMPKGKARIRATFIVRHLTGATVTVEQVLDGENVSPQKVIAEFPDLLRYLGHDYERYETSEGERAAPFLESSEEPVGALPVA